MKLKESDKCQDASEEEMWLFVISEQMMLSDWIGILSAEIWSNGNRLKGSSIERKRESWRLQCGRPEENKGKGLKDF